MHQIHFTSIRRCLCAIPSYEAQNAEVKQVLSFSEINTRSWFCYHLFSKQYLWESPAGKLGKLNTGDGPGARDKLLTRPALQPQSSRCPVSWIRRASKAHIFWPSLKENLDQPLLSPSFRSPMWFFHFPETSYTSWNITPHRKFLEMNSFECNGLARRKASICLRFDSSSILHLGFGYGKLIHLSRDHRRLYKGVLSCCLCRYTVMV